jgi:hypothetical protein
LLLTISAVWLLWRVPLTKTWPVLLLLPYLLYPEPNPAFAIAVAAMAVLTWLQLGWSDKRPMANSSNGGCEAHATAAGRPSAIGAGLILATVFAILYWRTLAPGVLPADSGELQVVAATLGVAHPPGFPLYTLLAHSFTRLFPRSSPAYSVNLFSALISAATLFFAFLTTWGLTGRRRAGLVAALALGTATTFWAQATTANIRGLTALFATCVIYLLIRFRQTIQGADQTGPPDRYLIVATAVMSLGLTHHASLAFMAVVFGLFVFMTDPSLLRRPARWPPLLLAGLSGLLPLLYLPLRASSGGRGATADLATLSGFLDHVLARGFRGDFFYFIEPAALLERFKVMGNVMTFQFDGLLLIGMVVGGLLLLWRDRPLALLLVGSFAVHTLVTATYRAPQTVEYMLPAYVAAALCLGYAIGIFVVATSVVSNRTKPLLRAGALVFAALTLVASVNQGLRRFASYDYLHREHTAREFAETLLNEAPPDSIILAHWHWVTPLWYLQEVEGQRPDVESRFVFPEGESYPDNWARRVEEAFASGRPVIATYYDTERFTNLPLPEPVGEAFLFSAEPKMAIPSDFTPLTFQLGGTIEVMGYRLETPAIEISQEAILTIAWRPQGAPPGNLTIFIHLVGPDGVLYGQQDRDVTARDEGITLTRFHLAARPGAMPGDYSLMVGAYATEPLLDTAGSARTPISTISIIPVTFPPITGHRLYRTVEGETGRRLIGYDWDETLPGRSRLYLHWQMVAGYVTEVRDDQAAEGLALPAYRGPWGIPQTNWQLPRQQWPPWGWGTPPVSHYVPFAQGIVWTGETVPADVGKPGASLTLDQYLQSARPLTNDLVISVRLIGLESDGFHWAWWDLNDSIPALGAIPTLKWIAGSAVRSPHSVTISPESVPGQAITGALTLYDAFTGRPLGILDERMTAEFAWVPLTPR